MSFLNKLFGKDESSKNALNTPIAAIREDREGYLNVGQSVYPVVRNAEDPRLRLGGTINPIVSEFLADGLVTCYALDTGNTFEMISAKHLNDFGLSIDDIKMAAYRNLAKKVNENCQIGIVDLSSQNAMLRPFYRANTDANFNPSLMLVDEFWEEAKKVLKSDSIAVSIPARNILFFSDWKEMESFRTMRPIAGQLYDSSIGDGLQLTKDTYIRKNGKWIRFLDTEEQWAELW